MPVQLEDFQLEKSAYKWWIDDFFICNISHVIITCCPGSFELQESMRESVEKRNFLASALWYPTFYKHELGSRPTDDISPTIILRTISVWCPSRRLRSGRQLSNHVKVTSRTNHAPDVKRGQGFSAREAVWLRTSFNKTTWNSSYHWRCPCFKCFV